MPPVHTLNAAAMPYLLAGVRVLDLSAAHTLAPGNKWFKLAGNLDAARAAGARSLLSFGGTWSNHLHALAAVGCEQGMATIGIVREEPAAELTPTLRDAQRWGMKLKFVTRGAYRQRGEREFLHRLQAEHPQAWLIPEGGANAEGVHGARAIAGQIVACTAGRPTAVVLAVGTGTTLAGIVSALPRGYEVTGISALRGAGDLDARVRQALRPYPAVQCSWRILHDYHCGGFARVTPALKAFMLAVEGAADVALDPVYTAKALYAVHCLRAQGIWMPGEPVLLVHTGGLQGRRGYPWLDASSGQLSGVIKARTVS